MAIIARDLGSSAKKVTRTLNYTSGIATGVTSVLHVFPFDSILKGVQIAAFGLSGAPQYSLSLLRFAGGQTAIPVGYTCTPTAFGTSGVIGFSLVAPGFTLIAGDMLLLTSGVANTAVASATVQIVYQTRADITVFPNTVG